MKKESRFVTTYKQEGVIDMIEVLVDKETGVNYIFKKCGFAGGLSVLIDKDGKPVITPIESNKYRFSDKF